jgi:hypothetical protein
VRIGDAIAFRLLQTLVNHPSSRERWSKKIRAGVAPRGGCRRGNR